MYSTAKSRTFSNTPPQNHKIPPTRRDFIFDHAVRPYTLTQEVRSEEEALRLADLTLTKQLARAMEDGKVLSRSLSAEVRGDTLLVTLSAECEEQVGRLVELP